MRRQVVTTLGVVTLCMASYAATFMQVKTDDGKTVSFDVDHVTEVVFDTTSSDHEYVDLGLPSGTLWATCNIGATKPEEFGDYFAWGETEPKEVYDYLSYKYATTKGQFLESITKYNMFENIGIIDSLSMLLPEDDVVTVKWGFDWRMPTTDEMNELVENCEYKWIEFNGVYGAKFIGKNGKSVFFPAAGFRRNMNENSELIEGYYWSSSISLELEDNALLLYFRELGILSNFDIDRCKGLPVRAVRAKK